MSCVALRRGVIPRTIKSIASPRLPAVATFGRVMTMKHRWSNEFDPTGLTEQGRIHSANNLAIRRNVSRLN